MESTANLNHQNERHCQKKGSRLRGFSFWGGTPDLETETSEVSAGELSGSSYPLSQARVGSQVWIVGFRQKGRNSRLLGMGLTPGVKLEIVNSQPSGSVIVALQSHRMGLGAGIANKIIVSDRPSSTRGEKEEMTETKPRNYLREMPVGTLGRVLGYDRAMRSYKGKLLSMGLTPNTEFTVVRVAPLGDPVEIKVRGFSLSLRKQEADALIVEVIDT